MKIAVICTGNTHRSAAAEYIGRKLWPQHQWESYGLGKASTQNKMMAKPMRDYLAQNYDISLEELTKHRSRSFQGTLNQLDQLKIDVVLCCAPIHFARVKMCDPHVTYVVPLYKFGDLPSIADPGFGAVTCEFAAQQVEKCLRGFIDRFQT